MGGLARQSWFRPRGYVHFDTPAALSEIDEVLALVSNPDWIAKRAFWPLVSYRQEERRAAKDGNGFRKKTRPIAYASHLDSSIYSYYTRLLEQRFEPLLVKDGLQDIVLAYRHIPVDATPNARGKTNFHFAVDAFCEIASRGNCEAVAMDLSKFFDTLPHRHLKANWQSVLGVERLPPDHYAVFQAATQFAQVSERQIRKALGVGKRVLRAQRSYAMDSTAFDEKVRNAGLINVNRNPYGIPQGLPISGLLANICMIDVDRQMRAAAISVHASYRRYSDDVLLIGPPNSTAALSAHLESLLHAMSLKVNGDKTECRAFCVDTEGHQRACKPLQYLGLQFDGQSVTVRPQTLVRYGKRMRRAVRRAARVAEKHAVAGQPVKIRRRALYAKFSHLAPHPETHPQNRPRSTVFRYAARAASFADSASLNFDFHCQIREQFRGHWGRLNQLIRQAESELNTPS